MGAAAGLASPRQLRSELEGLTDADLHLLRARMRWKKVARAKQIPPPALDTGAPWDFFGIKSGRGFGKTLSGAQWLALEALNDPHSINFVIAPTHDDLIGTCFYGPTGLHGYYTDKATGQTYPVIAPALIADSTKSPPMIYLKNGAVIRGFSAERPERLRGPQCFPGETAVTMANGSMRRIDTVRLGDYVLTRKGARKVMAAWRSGRDAPLWRLGTNGGRSLSGTMKHLVWTDNRGFVQLCRLNPGDVLCTTTDSNSANAKTATSYTKNVLACASSESDNVLTCIVTSTQKKWGLFLRNVMYIIGTAIGGITGDSTSKLLPRKSMPLNMQVNENRPSCSWKQRADTCRRFGVRLVGKLYGVHRAIKLSDPAHCNRDLSAVFDAKRVLGPTHSSLSRVSVWSVPLSSLPGSPSNSFVRSGAVAGTGQRGNQDPSSLCIDVVKHVEKLATCADVYDLTVEGEHEFFADGILVHNCHRGWLDECASWRYPTEVWDNFIFGLRLGTHPQVFWTGTPKPKPFINMLVSLPKSITISGSTYENSENLPDSFYENIAKYEGTKIGRQEIYGEIIDPEEAGFVKRSDIRMWPAKKPLPKFRFIIMSLDTALTEETWDKKTQTGDPTACTVWGLFEHERKEHLMLLDAWEDYLGFPQLVRRVKLERTKTYGDADEPVFRTAFSDKTRRPKHTGRPPDLILIEDKGSGISLRQQLAIEQIITETYNPGDLDKLSRLHAVSPLFPHGRVWCIESVKRPGQLRAYADPVVSQLCTYVGQGSLEHDDLLDSSTQALLLMMHKFNMKFTVRANTQQQTEAALSRIKAKQRRNPYDG